MGEVQLDEYPWLHVSYAIDSSGLDKHVLLEVCFLRGYRDIRNWRLYFDDGVKWTVRDTLPRRTLMDVLEPAWTTKGVFEGLVDEIRPRIYEGDPRIGMVRENPWFSFPFPACPLFDPPNFVWPGWRGPLPEEWERVRRTRPCPFCHEPFDVEGPPMWAGGNLQWAHERCWGQGLRLPTGTYIELPDAPSVR